MELGVIDDIMPEPVGGSHRDRAMAMGALGKALEVHLDQLSSVPPHRLKELRREKFLSIGSKGLS